MIAAVSVVPKKAPLVLRIRHTPECAPVVLGAVIGTRRSAVAPGAVAGTATTVLPVIASPLTKTNASLVLQAHVPEFRTRQILLKTCPPESGVPSGTVTSVTKVEFKQPRAAGTAVAVAAEPGVGVEVAELAKTKTETAAGSLVPFDVLIARTVMVCGPTVAFQFWMTVYDTCG